MKKSIIINLMGAPCAGKSTFATLLFATLKKKGVSCEYVDEFAKDMVWEDRTLALNDQLFMLANQNYKLVKVNGKVNVIITDSPLLLNIYYNKYMAKYNYSENIFNKLVMESYSKFDNFNFYLERNFPYVEEGRYQTEKESKAIDLKLKSILKKQQIEYLTIENNEYWLNKISDIIINLCSLYKDYNKTSTELERRFLLTNIPQYINNFSIKQTYLSLGTFEKRVRECNGKYFFTEKIGRGKVRQEFEIEISKEEYEYLINNYKKGNSILKERYPISLEGTKCCEINHFIQPTPLNIVEVEFNNESDMRSFIPPEWFGDEVTKDFRYNSFSIAMENA